ncbi:MAG: thioredoxin family protein [Oscillospiraceae bacterium]|jgi:thioredoxin 1|nr:thioredoxin family protein [Oscillospiraceae bacterium]
MPAITAQTPVLLDFYSESCAPCRRLKPVLAALAQMFEGRVEIQKINAGNHPELAEAYDVQTLPTLLLLHCGKELWRGTGFITQEILDAKLNQILEGMQ